MLGNHSAITADQARILLEAKGDDEALAELLEDIENEDGVISCGTDKAWDPIVYALSPEWIESPWPARGVICGNTPVHDDDDTTWIGINTPDEVAAVAEFLASLSDEEFTAAYDAIPQGQRNDEYGPEELTYALDSVADLRTFFADAARAGSHTVFSVFG